MHPELTIDKQMHCDYLITEITRYLGRPLAPNVHDAFSQVPRDLFIEHYYEQQGHTLFWKQIAAPTFEMIYRDEPLVTSIDERGLPASSSSQPGIMAAQLEALDLYPGQRVLEIGTGTGYNAALMGYMVSPTGTVVSIDIDETFVTSARLHLQCAGCENVLVLVGDGWAGEATYAPYDRILATCGIRTIPFAWLQQMRQGGVMISNILLNLASIFVRLEKIDECTFHGYCLPLEAQYMEIRRPHDVIHSKRRGTNWLKYGALPHYDIALSDDGTALFDNTAFCLLLYCLSPNVSKHYRWLDDEDRSILYIMNRAEMNAAVCIHENRLTVYGAAEQLATQIKQSIAFYKQQGCPDITCYELQIVDEQVTLIINSHRFPLPLLHPQAVAMDNS